MRWNRWDICEAWFMYATMYHEGQGSKLYKVLSTLIRLGYKPGLSTGFPKMNDNTRGIYIDLLNGAYIRER